MKDALFLHIQKTAGSSVQLMARENYPPGEVISHGDFLTLGQAECAEKRFVSGHFGFAYAEPLMSGRFSFTFLREPKARVVSLYHYCRGVEGNAEPIYEAARSLDLLDFLVASEERGYRAQVWNNQVWQLACGYGHDPGISPAAEFYDTDPEALLETAKSNLDAFDYVGFQETFELDARAIFRALGARRIKPRRSNRRGIRKTSAPLAREVTELLEEMMALDRDLYRYAARRFDLEGRLRKSALAALHPIRLARRLKYSIRDARTTAR